MNRTAMLILTGILSLGLAACGRGDTKPQAQAGGADARVQEIYKQNCLSCHGANLEGRVGPPTNLQHIGASRTKEQIAAQIQKGGGGMPSFGGKLKPDEVAVLADWLAAKK
jgi:cytochrome c551